MWFLFQILGTTDGLRVRFTAPLLFFFVSVERVVSQVQVAWTVLEDEHDHADDEHGDECDEWKQNEDHCWLDFAFSFVQLNELFSTTFPYRLVGDSGVFNWASISCWSETPLCLLRLLWRWVKPLDLSLRWDQWINYVELTLKDCHTYWILVGVFDSNVLQLRQIKWWLFVSSCCV